jgi:hypothetical protein
MLANPLQVKRRGALSIHREKPHSWLLEFLLPAERGLRVWQNSNLKQYDYRTQTDYEPYLSALKGLPPPKVSSVRLTAPVKASLAAQCFCGGQDYANSAPKHFPLQFTATPSSRSDEVVL